MGSLKGEKEDGMEEKQERVKSCMACLWMGLASMLGGLLLVWWENEFHPTNRQLWIVPVGLILLVTPIVVICSAFVSDLCSESVDLHGDPEIMIKGTSI